MAATSRESGRISVQVPRRVRDRLADRARWTQSLADVIEEMLDICNERELELYGRVQDGNTLHRLDNPLADRLRKALIELDALKAREQARERERVAVD